MSETLRDLVVSLSLQTDNFTRNIKSVNKQIQEAESKFRLAAAGIEGFEKTATGLSTQLSTLERRLQLQKDAVTQYEKALTAANAKLQECYNRQNDYAQRLTDAKTAQQALKEQVGLAAQQYRTFAATLGETDSATIASKENLDQLKVEYRAQCAEVRKLTGQNAALKKSTQNAADAVSQANINLNGARAAIRLTESEISMCNRSLALAQTNWDAAGKSIEQSRTAITSFGKQISLAESKFKLATVGIKDMDSSAGGLTARLTMLRDKLSLQENTVNEYENALRGAKEQLKAAQDAHDPEKIQQASDAVIDAETALIRAKTALTETRQGIEKTNKDLKTAQSAWTEAGQSLDAFSKYCDKVSKVTSAVGRTLTTVMTTPILALGSSAIKASVSFESAFTSVRKTVNASEAEFSALSSEIKGMSTEIATSADDIAEVVAIAGQLGIGTDYLTEFARTMIDLGNSTDIVADEAASTLAKFANITGMNQSLFANLGSTLVQLGNNYATTESAIMNMSMRLAAAGHQVGLSESQILGFATALSSVGIEAEMGGSAFSKALVKMEVAAATGGEALDDFAKVSGMTADQFKALWDADPAAAFQAFIVGLSQMDEQGMSAIATLEEIGIAEIRLRDTLLRATNATELFAETQIMANSAWEDNSALLEEAGKRYQTTASRLVNLKNKAVLFGQQIGDDLNPVIQELIGGADDLLDSFLDMDEAQRQQIVRWAAIAAAAGPALLGISKVTKGLSTAAGGIGKFASAVGKAGGGFKGFLSVLGSSPSVWMAVAAAVMVGTVALADYVSGAKQAREALEGMAETARTWKDTAADTFYGHSEGLSFFGMSESDFVRETQNAQEWLTGLIAAWTDGKKDTDEAVAAWTESFKSLTGDVRDQLSEMKEAADESGLSTVSSQLSEDIALLDSMDQEVERLLKKRQNGYLTEGEKIRLQELIDTREALIVRYRLTPENTDSFETIAQKLAAEVARAQARGKTDADVIVYENALLAAAQGMAAVNAEIDAQYDKEYALIMLIEDAAERQTALDELNLKYNENRRDAALEYAQTMASVVMPVWQQDDIQQAAADIDALNRKLREYSMASETDKPGLLADLNEITANMDEGSLIEYVGLLTQIQSLMDSGLTEAEITAMFPEINVSGAMAQLASVQDYLDTHQLELPGLASMFSEAIPEEALKIATDLDMTGAQARWDEFAANPGVITTEAVIAGYQADAAAVPIQPVVDAFIASYTEIPEGASTADLTPDGLIAYVEKYAEVTSGADLSGLTPEIAECLVAGYRELASGADVSLLKPSEIVAYVSAYAQQKAADLSALSPEGITAVVMAYEEIEGGALTTALTPSDIAAIVTEYLLGENVDMSKVTDAHVDALVTAYAEAANCDKTALKAKVTAQITSYVEAEGLTVPIPTAKVQITGYDFLTYQDFRENSGMSVEIPVRLGELPKNELAALEAEGKLRYWQNGIEIPVAAVPEGMITPDTIAAMDEDGTMHILISPQVTGTQEALGALAPLLNEVDRLGITDTGMLTGVMPATTIDMIGSAVERINSYTNSLNYSGWQKFWAALRGESIDRDVLDQSMRNDFDAESVAGLSAYISEMVSAVSQGSEVSGQDIENLKSISEFLSGLDTTGTGAHIKEGIAQGMTDAGWASDAETVAANLESALNLALGIQSPSKRVRPVGENVSAGIGSGMSGYDFTADAESAASGIKHAVDSNLTGTTLHSAGVNVMAGLQAGIYAGRAGVVSAMRSAARAAVNAAKAELKIKSPSQVFADEVGVMTMRGFGQGVLKESKEQARVIRNASRYLTGEAQNSAIAYNTNDNRRTYNNSVNSTIQVAQMVVRDEQDIRSLAVEIAALTRRQQRGKGLRMA